MRPPTAAAILGYAGLAPFFALALGALFAGDALAARAADGLIAYGAAILSFMGGCRWGFAAAGLGSGPSFEAFGISVLPALLGFAVLLFADALGAPLASAALIAGFVALFFWDRAGARSGDAPAWWTALRAPLTIGATASLATLLV